MQKNKAIKTEWDLKQFYKSVDDPQIEKDIKYADKLASAFEKKYRKNETYLKSDTALLKALKEDEDLAKKALNKPIMYLHYAQSLNSNDEKIIAKSNLVSQELNKIYNKMIFFGVKLSKIDKNIQKNFLKSKKLSHFKYSLEKTFEASKYVLTEPEERILSLKSLTSRGLWTDLTDKLQNQIVVDHKGEKIPLSKSGAIVSKIKDQKGREELHRKNMAELEKIAEVATAELNAVVTDKKINDEIRGYKEAYDATILAYENDKKSVLNLVKIVTDNFNVSARFYKLKAKMLKLQILNYSDRNAEVGENNKKVPFEESYNTLQKVFDGVDVKYGDILRGMVSSGRVDVFPKVGKASGAFCSGNIGTPTMVLLNHNDDLNSHMTFAHEMGHAIHTEFSKNQSPIYQGYSTSTAEVASTLFESFAFYDVLEKMTEEEKKVALHDKISDDVSTIFRQIACFNFEVEMHKTIRRQGAMSKDEFISMMNKHMGNYLGDSVKMQKHDGFTFVSWSHLRYMFYVYSYAFGQLASKALYKKYSEDKNYIEKINKFLSAGGSMSPEDIFKSIGLDVRKPDFFKKGIESINDDIVMLEKLVNKR